MTESRSGAAGPKPNEWSQLRDELVELVRADPLVTPALARFADLLSAVTDEEELRSSFAWMRRQYVQRSLGG